MVSKFRYLQEKLMSKRQSTKSAKELQVRFGRTVVRTEAYYDHLDFRCMEDFDDDAFAYLMRGVKGVNMLDLNETDIGNESIRLLTSLEYVNEIRAKECYNLTNDCVEHLNKMTSLVLLHLKSTAITVDGLLRLDKLKNLRTLMFSADDVELIKEELVQLKAMMPECELVINSKPYFVSAISVFLHSIKEISLAFRLKIKNEALSAEWSSGLTQPSYNYLEAEQQGSFSIEDIEWVEIKHQKKSITEYDLDHSPDIKKLLSILDFPYMITAGITNVYLLDKQV